MSKKTINTEAAERIKQNQIQTLGGFSLGDMVWARLQDGSVGYGSISYLYDAAAGQSACFCDKESNKFRTVALSELSREEIKGRRKKLPKGGASAGFGHMRIKPAEEVI